jgi:hypothetical protein
MQVILSAVDLVEGRMIARRRIAARCNLGLLLSLTSP